MKTIEFTNDETKWILGFLFENFETEQKGSTLLKKPMLLTCRRSIGDDVLNLAKKYRCHFMTNVTNMLGKQTVYEIHSLDMARDMVEELGCYLIFNLQ